MALRCDACRQFLARSTKQTELDVGENLRIRLDACEACLVRLGHDVTEAVREWMHDEYKGGLLCTCPLCTKAQTDKVLADVGEERDD